MSVEDFVFLLVDDSQQINLYSFKEEKVVFKGEACEIDDEHLDEEVWSIDPIENNTITLNID